MDGVQLEFKNLKSSVYGYHLMLLCTVAYYGDGKITEAEMNKLLEITDGALQESVKILHVDLPVRIPDRELVIKEELLEILDVLKDLLSEISEEERYEAALDIAKNLSEELKSSAEKKYQKDELKPLYKELVDDYNEMAEIDGEYSEQEKELIDIIKKSLGVGQFKELFFGWLGLFGIGYCIYMIFQWMFS